MKDLVSIIISCRGIDINYLQDTINNLRTTAKGDIEIIVSMDGFGSSTVMPHKVDKLYCYPKPIGLRVAENIAVNGANGKYLFFVDSHCFMSDGWDEKMKASCEPNRIITTTFGKYDEREGKLGLCYLDNRLDTIWQVPYRPNQLEEPTMAFIGCSWMIRKEYFYYLGGHDESLGAYGALGPEWSLKCWLTGGELLIRTDVVCSHLFREKTPYKIDVNVKKNAFLKLNKMWVKGKAEGQIHPYSWLWRKFHQCKTRKILRYA